ncbi:MAG TPA: HEAT repeat domain-containing protein [Candidatus Limnocylindrales bacterium]|nr:HEAT repeat domain-containing protein [Candidatus Limnocylindrales bacterium]
MSEMTEREVADSVDLALSLDDDDNARWDIVSKLHFEGGQAAFDAAERLCVSTAATGRMLGADILGQVGFTLGSGGASEGPFRDAAMRALLDLVEREGDAEVLAHICAAFGHLKDPRAVGPLVRLREHPDAWVRFSVACGLMARPEREALDALIELSADPDEDVRNWATFGLAQQTDQDFPELREALAARTDDPDLETRAEALHGLATRGDRRALGPLLEWREKRWEVSDPELLDEALEALGEVGSGGGEQGCA